MVFEKLCQHFSHLKIHKNACRVKRVPQLMTRFSKGVTFTKPSLFVFERRVSHAKLVEQIVDNFRCSIYGVFVLLFPHCYELLGDV